MIREAAERQGLISDHGAMQLTPQAYRVFQGKLLERIFSQLQESNSGRHQDNVVGEGAVEIQQTKPYEFGDSVAQMDIPQSLINAMVRGGFPLRMRCDDIEIGNRRDHGYERFDALRGTVHQCQANGARAGWPNPQ
jgi:uncharacterized protein with von Willebrand factor type A (vWA) domain